MIIFDTSRELKGSQSAILLSGEMSKSKYIACITPYKDDKEYQSLN